MNKEQELIYNNLISKYNFDNDQKTQIRNGLENELNVEIYAKPEYSVYQMKEIRLNLWSINKQISDHNC